MYTIDAPPRRSSKRLVYFLAVLLLMGAYVGWALLRPLPQLHPETVAAITSKTNPSTLVWPAEQAAVGIADSDILETHGAQTPVPTASTAKVVTSLVVLDKKPLRLGEQGPILTISASDKALFDHYFANDGSLVPVRVGEKISQYQVLQTIMLPSANNMADTMAIWAFGSLENYSKAANAYLKQHGINNTTIGKDASGLDPTSKSTAEDLVKIGKLAMENPVLAQIAGQTTATGIPVANTINNVNGLLGHYNIIGLKTGNSNEAGGAFISASTTNVNNKKVTIVTAVMNAKDLVAAMKNSVPLIQSAQANFKPVTVSKANDIVGYYQVPWGGYLPVTAAKDLSLSTWNGSTVTATAQLSPIRSDAKSGQTVGKLSVPPSATNHKKSVNLNLASTPEEPTLVWRLTHPIQ